jgi:hypothetical protein
MSATRALALAVGVVPSFLVASAPSGPATGGAGVTVVASATTVGTGDGGLEWG